MIHVLKLEVEIKNIHGLAVLNDREEKKNYKPQRKFISRQYNKRKGKKNSSYILKLRQLPYKAYLQTSHWTRVKGYVYKKFGRLCLQCGGKENLNVHHESYLNRGDYEKEKNDCVVLCGICHAKEHGIV